MQRMKELIEILNAASRAYYQEDREILSNYEYDRLYDELLSLEASAGVILSDSPTQKVGYTILGSLTKVRHEQPMLSLNKTKSVAELESFLDGQKGLLSLKLDGLTIVLRYSSGELKQAVTRGNGEVGEDVTHNARAFKGIPLRVSVDGELTVRGEAVISYREFEKINEGLDPAEKYKNPRNLCSGTVRQLNSEIAAGRGVRFFAFSLVSWQQSNSKEDDLRLLSSLGFDIVNYKAVTASQLPTAVEDYKNILETYDYACDGLVLTYDDKAFSSSLGATSKFPRDSIAFKWQDELAETTLTEIIWNTSRTGLINPVAVFEPVELEGTTVNRASLHNVSILESLELGPGDRITVYKANMIIPQVNDNLTRSNTAQIPSHCPVCGGHTEISGTADAKVLYCTNPQCRAQLVRALTHFVSRDAMNIEGLSEATIEKFVDRGFIGNYTEIFELSKYEEDIKEMEGFGEKSFANLMNSIEAAKTTTLPNFIYALGISQVGLSNAKLLCKYFDSDLEKIRGASADELIQIEGFGEVIAQSIEKFFSDEENSALLDKVLTFLSFPKPAESSSNQGKVLEGKTFVITGDLNSFPNRKALQDDIELRGGKVSASVSAKTNFLVNNDIQSSSSKNKKAKELGVSIITEDDYLKMTGGIKIEEDD